MKKETLLMLALALALTGCKDTKNNVETADPQQNELKQEQNVKDDDAEEDMTLDTDDADDQKATEKKTSEEKTADEKTSDEPQQAKNKSPMVYCTSNDGFLNIREYPNASAKILGKLLTGGAGAEYLGSSGNWYYVRYKGTEGYVNSKYAKLTGLEESSQRVAGSNRKVYYVVVGSYESLSEAKKAMYAQPDVLEGSNVYRAKDKNGRKVFRQCDGCYYSRSEAQEHVKGLNDFLDINAWIWESDGPAPCVYQGIGLNGEPSSIEPK